MGSPETTDERPLPCSPRAIEAVRALARLARILERASDELSLAHYRVLAAIGMGGERASRIATKLALGKPTVSQSVDALSRRGLITRSPSSDQRANVLSLTDEGQAMLERVDQVMINTVGQLWNRTRDPSAIIDALAAMGEAADAVLDTGASLPSIMARN